MARGGYVRGLSDRYKHWHALPPLNPRFLTLAFVVRCFHHLRHRPRDAHRPAGVP